MREIRFRFWHKEFKKFVSPYGLGYQFQPENGQIYVDGCNITNRFIISQFTGLKDKNGKEIYEGDVINGLEVYWSTQWAMFACKGETTGALIRFADMFGVTGNIYETSSDVTP